MKWIDIKKQKPERGDCILISDGNFVTAAEIDYIEEDIWFDAHMFSGYECEIDFLSSDITHWAKLPNPPKGDN
jgi:hypothetical protein